MWWCGDAGFGAFFGFEDFLDLFWLIEASADADEGSCDDADHVVEKSVSSDGYGDLVSVPGYLKSIDGADGILGVGADVAKAFEVVCADEVICCLLHFVFIQWEGDVACGEPSEGIWQGAVENVIFVVFYTVLVSWVPVRRYFLRADNDNVFGQSLIDGIGEPFRWNSAFCVKHCYVSQCVNAGVGSAGSDDVDVLSGQSAEFFI